jgi:hypothetical protein
VERCKTVVQAVECQKSDPVESFLAEQNSIERSEHDTPAALRNALIAFDVETGMSEGWRDLVSHRRLHRGFQLTWLAWRICAFGSRENAIIFCHLQFAR